MEIQISYPLAFLAGLVSFLSPCVLPVVPSYVAFVSGMTLEELWEDGPTMARRAAIVHSTLFALGFMAVFLTLGLALHHTNCRRIPSKRPIRKRIDLHNSLCGDPPLDLSRFCYFC